MRAPVSSRGHVVMVALVAVVLMVLSVHPAVAIALALAGLAGLFVAGFVVSHRWNPRARSTAVLRDAVENQAICVVIGAVIGLSIWIGLSLNLQVEWAVLVGVVLALPVTLAFMRWVMPLLLPGYALAPRSGGHARRRTGLPVTDHSVTIVEGDPGDGRRGRSLVALCDVEDCGWMEFAPPGDLATQEERLRALAARHTTAAVPEVNWAQT